MARVYFVLRYFIPRWIGQLYKLVKERLLCAKTYALAILAAFFPFSIMFAFKFFYFVTISNFLCDLFNENSENPWIFKPQTTTLYSYKIA